MKKDIGIIGGAGPEAGILLAQHIIRICQEDYQCKVDADFPYVALFSFPFSDMLRNEDKQAVEKELHNLIEKECSQTVNWAIACNTLHSYLGNRQLPNHFVNMLEITGQALTVTPIVLCTTTSRKNKIHRCWFDCDYPKDQVQQEVDALIYRLIAEPATPETFQKFQTVIAQYPGRTFVLGCTEFSLLRPYVKNDKTILDPLHLTAEKLCALHFKR